MKKYDNLLKYEKMFLDRWETMKNQPVLVDENGDTKFLQNDVFDKFFINPELLVGYYIWRGGNVKYAYDIFLEEYDGWQADCKEIAKETKNIFEKEIFNIKEYKIYEPLEKCVDALLFDSGTVVAHMTCEVEDYIVDIDLTVCGEVDVEYKGVDYKSPCEFPKELKKIIKNHYTGVQNMTGFCYVKDNNWLEFLYEVKDKADKKHCYSGGVLFEGDLCKYNQEELKKEFLTVCKNALGYNN